MATLKIPVTKAGRTLDVDTDALPEESYRIALEEGLKVLLNKGMSKITTKGLEGSDLDKAKGSGLRQGHREPRSLHGWQDQARPSRCQGCVWRQGARRGYDRSPSPRQGSRQERTPCRRHQDFHVEASEITKAANELLAVEPSFIEQAKTNIEARSAKVTSINIASLVHTSPKLVAKAEAAKAEKKSQLSAKQAGKVAPRKSRGAEASA